MESHEMLKLFGEHFPKGPHVLESGTQPRVWRVHVADPGGSGH